MAAPLLHSILTGWRKATTPLPEPCQRIICNRCDGDGRYDVEVRRPYPAESPYVDTVCEPCHGNGHLPYTDCFECDKEIEAGSTAFEYATAHGVIYLCAGCLVG